MDINENMVIGIYNSQNEAVKIMNEQYNVNICAKTISDRLNNKVTTPYKGRFMFYYATDEEVKKYLEDNKAS